MYYVMNHSIKLCLKEIERFLHLLCTVLNKNEHNLTSDLDYCESLWPGIALFFQQIWLPVLTNKYKNEQ